MRGRLCCAQELLPDHLRASGRALRDSRAGLQSTLKGWFSMKATPDDEKSPEDIAALEVRIFA